MKALILVNGAALAVSAASTNEGTDTMPEAQPGQEQRMDDLVERVIAGSLTFRNGKPMQDGDLATVKSEDLRALCDRLILYREALEVLLLVKDAVDYRGDACHPAEMVGAVLDKCILERIDDVLSRSGG